jgi:uncharacterized protein involved in exopolysaccharide biosynthesis
MEMNPDSGRTPSPLLEAQPANDEVSLRDVYLTVKRGFFLIVGVAVLAGLVAFVVSSLLPEVYQAQSSTLVSPPPVSAQASGALSLTPGSSITFETYQTLAFSQPVLTKVIQEVPDAKLTVAQLSSMGSLEEIIGPQSQSQAVPLEVVHKITATDPRLATKLANTWAESTVAVVQSSLLANLAPVNATTESEVTRLKAELDEAEAAYQAFNSQNNLSLLQAREASLSATIDDAENQLVVLPGTGLSISSSGGLQAPKVNLEQEIVADEAFLSSLQQQAGQHPSQALEQQIVSRQALLSSLKARQALLAQQLVNYRSEYQQVEEKLATIGAKGDELKRDLSNAKTAYQSVVALAPDIAYLSKLTPHSARVFSNASVPVSPVGPHRLRNTVLAFVIGGILALLFVFLREAVSSPPLEAKPASRQDNHQDDYRDDSPRGDYVSAAESGRPSDSRV